MRTSREQDVATEWLRLTKLWESASARYAAACEASPAGQGQSAAHSVSAAIDAARGDLMRIKQQIDKLISTRARARAASRKPLRFGLLEVPTKPVVESVPPESPTLSDQAAARYHKR